MSQKAGNAIFVPSNWWHQVKNIDDTVSCNHNWINACNLDYVTGHLVDQLAEIEESISALRSEMEDFDDHCQLMLRSLAGWNFKDFDEFLDFIETKRRIFVQEN